MPRRTETWGSELEFYLVTLGCAVGFGCIWRFPYTLYENGGGVFLIPYITCLVVFCIPQTYLEFNLGQYWKLPLQEMYRKYSRKWRGTAIASFCICFCVSIFYILIMSYCL
jgi:NSS family neurotransmitter:Na+ symporter